MIMWTPLSVSTISLISPTLSAYVASSKGFCIWPFPKEPRSPPRLAELQSEYRAAMSSNLALPEVISSRRDLSWETALSLVVLLMMRPSGSFHEAFRREPWCLISICEALTLPDEDEDDILVFFLCLSVRSDEDEEIEDFFLFRSESIFAICEKNDSQWESRGDSLVLPLGYRWRV